MTLRDELLVNDDYEEELPRIPKSSSRWKQRLGLRRGSSKKDKNKNNEGFQQTRVDDEKGFCSGQGDKTAS